MSLTLYISNPNALIPQAGRAVDTFASGLVRVSHTFLGRTANAAAHRATLAVGNNMPDGNSSPCIDGLKIFPEPQERRREDGLTEFIVSAYGRANSVGKLSKSFELQTVQVPTFIVISNLPEGQNNSTTSFPLAVNVSTIAVTKSLVVPAITELAEITLPPADDSLTVLSTAYDSIVASLMKLYTTATFSLSGLDSAISVDTALTSMSRNSYGAFDEVVLTVSGKPTATGFAQINLTL